MQKYTMCLCDTLNYLRPLRKPKSRGPAISMRPVAHVWCTLCIHGFYDTGPGYYQI